MEPDLIVLLKQAEAIILDKQKTNANRNNAIALTHLQTAILWLQNNQS